jgi:hypothetical protein
MLQRCNPRRFELACAVALPTAPHCTPLPRRSASRRFTSPPVTSLHVTSYHTLD